MKNSTLKLFSYSTKEGTLESDEDNKDVINLKRKLKTTRESFQFAKDSGNEERALKKKKLVEEWKMNWRNCVMNINVN